MKPFVRLWLGAAVLLAFAGMAAADFPKPASTQVQHLHHALKLEQHTYSQPRPLRVWVATLDLTCPNVELVLTGPAQVEPPHHVRTETTYEFAKREGTLLAVNACIFGPNEGRSGMPATIEGLLLSRGRLVAPPKPGMPMLLFDARNQPHRLPGDATAEQIARFHHGLAGFQYVLEDGVNRFDQQPATPLHPRTALGLAPDRKTLFVLVVDGRQPGFSEGVSERELAELGRSIGCGDVLNLDGGGSTTLVTFDSARREQRVANQPVGLKLPGTLRPVGGSLGVRVWTGQNGVTAGQLCQIMPNLKAERALELLAPLNLAMREFTIDTPLRRAAFLAQLAHESGELRWFEELASGEAYENRKDLGNTQPGDGKRYKGRGPLQLTGRANYRDAGRALGIDLELKPELAADPAVGFRVAGWFWCHKQLNRFADVRDLEAITHRVNGGLRGLEQRRQYYQRALETLVRVSPEPAAADPAQ